MIQWKGYQWSSYEKLTSWEFTDQIQTSIVRKVDFLRPNKRKQRINLSSLVPMATHLKYLFLNRAQNLYCKLNCTNKNWLNENSLFHFSLSWLETKASRVIITTLSPPCTPHCSSCVLWSVLVSSDALRYGHCLTAPAPHKSHTCGRRGLRPSLIRTKLES